MFATLWVWTLYWSAVDELRLKNTQDMIYIYIHMLATVSILNIWTIWNVWKQSMLWPSESSEAENLAMFFPLASSCHPLALDQTHHCSFGGCGGWLHEKFTTGQPVRDSLDKSSVQGGLIALESSRERLIASSFRFEPVVFAQLTHVMMFYRIETSGGRWHFKQGLVNRRIPLTTKRQLYGRHDAAQDPMRCRSLAVSCACTCMYFWLEFWGNISKYILYIIYYILYMIY